jgi:hypothetical protein
MKDLQQEVFSRMTNVEDFDEDMVRSVGQAITTLAEENPIVAPGFHLGQLIARQAIMTEDKRMYDAAATVLWFIGVLDITEDGLCSYEDAMAWSDFGFPLAVKDYTDAVDAVIREEIGDI